MHWLRGGLLALVMTTGAAYAYVEVDMTGDIYQPPPSEQAHDRNVVDLPCSIYGDPGSGLPPCVVPVPMGEKSRQQAGQVQQLCRNVASAHGYITICSSISSGR
jgi:hypothetical protein